MFLFICFPPEGNFDIDAGDGVGWGGIRTPKITNKNPKIFRTKIVHTSGTSFPPKSQKCRKVPLKYLHIYENTPNLINAFKKTVYNVKHTKNVKMPFETPICFFEHFEKTSKKTIIHMLYILYNLYIF